MLRAIICSLFFGVQATGEPLLETDLIDTYLLEYGNQIATYMVGQQLISRLFVDYQPDRYRQALSYLESQAEQYPEAVLALSDRLQVYWDSHYLQSYLLASKAEYGKLKFISALGMIAGGVGLLKNPFASLGALRHLNLLLPIAGATGVYHSVTFFKKNELPPEPQQLLSFASGKNIFSYQQKRTDYLHRLFAVGAGVAGGQYLFQKLARDHDRIWRPRLKSKYLIGVIGAMLGYFVIEKSGYYLLRKIETNKMERQLQKDLGTLYRAIQDSDKATTIRAARQVSETTTKLVTIYEMSHLQTVIEFEQELTGPAGQQGVTIDRLQERLEQATAQLKFFADYQYVLPEQSASEAKTAVDDGKTQRNIGILWQTAMIFKVLSEEKYSYLQYFHDKMLAKFNNLSLIYENFREILEDNQLWETTFSREQLLAVIDVYLDYYHADQQSPVANGDQKILTSTRSFARFFAQEIVKLTDVGDFNFLLLEILDRYQHQAQQRQALAILVQDIDELVGDSYSESLVADGIRGGLAGNFALMGLAGFTNLLQKLGLDPGKRPLRWLAKLLSFDGGRQLNFAGLPTNSKVFKRLGIVGIIGAGLGVGMHYLQKNLRAKKLSPKKTLFETQLLVAVDLAEKTCQLQHDIKELASMDNLSNDQLEREREILAKLTSRFQQLFSAATHLNSFAPSLRVNHRLIDSVESNCLEITAVSIEPIIADLQQAHKILNKRKQILDSLLDNKIWRSHR